MGEDHRRIRPMRAASRAATRAEIPARMFATKKMAPSGCRLRSEARVNQ